MKSRVLNIVLIILLAFVSIVVVSPKFGKRTEYVTKTVTVRDTIITHDTITKVVTKDQIKYITRTTTEVIDTNDPFFADLPFNKCDSIRGYHIVAIDDSTAKIEADIKTRGTLTDYKFTYTVYPKTITVKETTTITKTEVPNNLYLLGSVNVLQASLYLGAAYTKKNWLFQAQYAPQLQQTVLGVGYKIR